MASVAIAGLRIGVICSKPVFAALQNVTFSATPHFSKLTAQVRNSLGRLFEPILPGPRPKRWNPGNSVAGNICTRRAARVSVDVQKRLH